MSKPKIGFIGVPIVPANNSRQFVGKGKPRNAKWNGEPQREPKKGELYLSGAVVCAYEAYADMGCKYFIAVPIHG